MLVIFAVSAAAPATFNDINEKFPSLKRGHTPSSNTQKTPIQRHSNHTRLVNAFFLNKSMATLKASLTSYHLLQSVRTHVGIMNTTPNAPTKMRYADIWAVDSYIKTQNIFQEIWSYSQSRPVTSGILWLHTATLQMIALQMTNNTTRGRFSQVRILPLDRMIYRTVRNGKR